MSTRRASVTDADTPDSPDHAPGVQLVQPAVAEATQPGLFTHLPDSALTEHHRAIADARPGDRMLLCLSLEVSASAAKVASALAFHGWTSWPSRETLGRFANLHPNHVSRACKELEDRGIISRRRRYHQGGNVGIQYTFNGDALVLAAADQNHPTLGHAIAQLAAGANTNLVSAAPEAGPDPAGANTNLVSAAPEAGPDPQGANTNLVSAQPEPGPREYQSGIGANTNLVPEPEVTEPERVTVTDEISQSNSGSSGSIETVPIPDWYSHLARQIDASRLPDFQDLHEAALLSGWTDRTMASAAAVYAKNYRSQRITDPVALFRKLATQEAGRQPPAVAQRHRNYSAEYHRRRLQGG